MNKPHNPPPTQATQAAALRQRAEALENAREHSPQSPESLEIQSPELTQKALHELRVHQIELEMQNEELRRAQVEIAAARERYFDLFDLAPVGYCTLSEQGLILEANLTAATLLEITRSALVGQRFSQFLLKEDQHSYYLYRQQLFASGQPQTWDLRMVKKDGTAFWVNLVATAVRDEGGEPTCHLTLSDINARKRMESCLEMGREVLHILNEPRDMRDSIQQVLAALKTHAGVDAVGIRLQDGDDFPYFAQDGFSQAFLQTENTLVQRAADGGACCNKDGHASLECTCGLVLSGQTNPANPLFTPGGSFWTNDSFPLLAMPPDRDPRLHPRNQCIHQGYASVALVPIRNKDAILGLIQFNDRRKGCFTLEMVLRLEEIAAQIGSALLRMRMEEVVRRQAALLDAATDAIYLWTMDDTVTYWNEGAERAFGWSRTEALGRNIAELLNPEPGVLEAARAALLQQGHWSGELAKTAKTGRQSVNFCRWTLLRDSQGQPKEIMAISTDITEKKQLEINFLRSQRMEGIGLLAGGIAHDLNNILTPILMTAPLLRAMTDDPEARPMIDTVEICAQRGADIIKQLLTFARGKPGTRAPLPMRHLLNEMIKLIHETFPRNIQSHIQVPADLWPVSGDVTQIHQALMNLCVNARDAMPEGGTLTLKADNTTLDEAFAAMSPDAKPGAYVRMSVTDTGTGIPPEILERIFDPFFTSKSIGKGTGLGLPTVLGIVRGHGGIVRVNSQIGQGTTFELHLPASPEARAEDLSEREQPPARGHGETVLVVDDEATVRAVMKITLEKYGYQVLTAGEGAEALALFAQHRLHIKAVITDMMMPGMDGPTLVQTLRQLDAQLPILGMTGLAERTGTKGLTDLPLQALLTKPFHGMKLLAALGRILARNSSC